VQTRGTKNVVVQSSKKELASQDIHALTETFICQFTQVLNILEIVLEKLDTRFLRLDGSTKVDERQGMVDEFTEDEEIKVFLLSTRAGGMGSVFSVFGFRGACLILLVIIVST
jgi:SNF2 family DNA or RNA helicase